MSSHWHRPTRLGFTLLELIVVIVILGILAALAIPTFQQVQATSKLEVAETTLAAVTRETQALAALETKREFTPTLLESSVQDLNGAQAAAGVYAATASWRTSTNTTGYAFDGRTILADVAPEQLDLALYVPGAGCAFASGDTTSVETHSVVGAPYHQCTAEAGTLSHDDRELLKAPSTPTGLRIVCSSSGCTLTWDGTPNVDIYKDGVKIGTSTTGTFVDPTGTDAGDYQVLITGTGGSGSGGSGGGTGGSGSGTGGGTGGSGGGAGFSTHSDPFTSTTDGVTLTWHLDPFPDGTTLVDIQRGATKIGTSTTGVFVDPAPQDGGTYSIIPVVGGVPQTPIIPQILSTPTPFPQAEGGVTLVVNGSVLQVAWNPVASSPTAPLTGYRLYRQSASGTDWTTPLWDGSATQYRDERDSDYSRVCYRVSAYGPGGESALSEAVCGATVAPIAAGNAVAWGHNGNGQLGTGTTSQASAPVNVLGLPGNPSQVSASGSSCAIVDGGAWCWGYNGYGQLGNGTTTNSRTPVQVTGLTSGVSAISTGNSHTCAVHNGAAKCWGWNTSGELGNGTQAHSSLPTSVIGLTSGVSAISAAQGHTCAVHNGAAKCWGSANSGRLGNSQGGGVFLAPVDVPGMGSGVTAISAGNAHTCAIQAGNAHCWGAASNGQLGNGGSASTYTAPVVVSGMSTGTVTSISAGHSYSCAVRAGEALCWGLNTFGQLGDGTTTNRSTPVSVSALGTNVTSISAANTSACAVQSGAALCWGNGERGQLGNGGITSTTTPVQVTGLTSGVIQLDARGSHVLAIRQS